MRIGDFVVTSVPKECPTRASSPGRFARGMAEANLCRGSSVETVRDEPMTSSLKRRDPRLPQKESS